MKQKFRERVRGVFRDIHGSRNLRSFPDLNVSRMDNAKGVVVLLHGFLGKPSNLSLFASSARQKEYDVWTSSFSSRETISHQVTHVLEMLNYFDEVYSVNPIPIHIVGHSLGGIVGVLAAERSNTSVTSVTTIASPLGGSPLAKFSPRGLPLADVAVGRDLVEEVLRARTGVPLFSVAGMRDPLVDISSAFALAKTPRSFGCLAVQESHATVLLSKRVVREVGYFQRRAEQDMSSFTVRWGRGGR